MPSVAVICPVHIRLDETVYLLSEPGRGRSHVGGLVVLLGGELRECLRERFFSSGREACCVGGVNFVLACVVWQWSFSICKNKCASADPGGLVALKVFIQYFLADLHDPRSYSENSLARQKPRPRTTRSRPKSPISVRCRGRTILGSM